MSGCSGMLSGQQGVRPVIASGQSDRDHDVKLKEEEEEETQYSPVVDVAGRPHQASRDKLPWQGFKRLNFKVMGILMWKWMGFGVFANLASSRPGMSSPSTLPLSPLPRLPHPSTPGYPYSILLPREKNSGCRFVVRHAVSREFRLRRRRIQ
ncbi:hypothetical protein ElyMa_000771100 [Elysia marginata]|uniref:Uncharacterized protein n=1 Tax=Elysia marginata TaxID=1093978 RepID=A0AAV4GVV2_9GAST|nr:hypothetical protein ElyMa_000771100 [Elysia marginata]